MFTLKRQVRNISACAIGSTLEWFDYTLYGTFATTLSKLFFPFNDQSISRIWIYLIFALGFFSRPIGGLVLGHIGDELGRKLALILSIITMSVPTFLVGILPTFQQIGIWAPILLATIRFFQGIAIGGEFTGSMVYLVEQSPSNKRGFWGSWSDFGSPLGVLLGLFVSTILMYSLTPEQFETFGWRIPFLLSAVVAVFGAYLRFGIDETQSFKKQTKKERPPIIETIKNHKETVLYAVSVAAYGGVTFYMLLTFLHNYLKISGIVSVQQASLYTMIVNIMITLAIPLGGYLSDIFSRKKIMLISVIVAIIDIFPTFVFLNFGWPVCHLIGETILGICLGLFFGGRAAFYAETFPARIRCTALALAFGISHSIFAGMTPLWSEILMKLTGSIYSLSLMMIIFAIFAILALCRLEDRTGKDLL